MMRVLDLFAGLGGWSAAFRDRGHEVVTIDIDPSFKPTIIKDVMSMTAEDCAGYDIILASPPCECFSVMNIGKNWTKDNRPRNDKARAARDLALHTFDIIKPYRYVLENPRAKLRKLLPEKPRATVWYCQYGERRAKPTDIWTNLPLSFRPPCHNGAKDHDAAPRGCAVGGTMDKDTSAAERARIPYALSLSICEQMETLMDIKQVPIEEVG